MTTSLQPPHFFQSYTEQIDSALKLAIEAMTMPGNTLSEAMRYSTLLGGKRIRPILVLATAECFGVAASSALPEACAVEFIHAYSLIHDDLPAMDDDDLRRGKPTCHKAFDEATAILAGDALQALAFEHLAQNHPPHQKPHQLSMIRILARASGARGMVLGQAIDLHSAGSPLDYSALENMHLHKTGALIEAAVLLGALSGESELPEYELAALKTYAKSIGLAFQVQDDILDITSDTETLGKQQGADLARNKPTYPSLLGLEGAKLKLQELHQQADQALTQLHGRDTQKLQAISRFIVDRHL